MKKLMALIVVAVLLLTAILGGCSKKDGSKSTAENNTDYMDTSSGEEAVLTDEYDNSNSGLQEDKTFTAGTEHKDEYSSVDKAPAAGAASDGDTSYNTTADISTSYNKSFSSEGLYEREQPVIPNTEEFTEITESGFMDSVDSPLSTFSIDVDTASYANLRKDINDGILPSQDAVRLEEMLNYFSYNYKKPSDGKPFSINTEIGRCPWNEEHYLLTVGLQGKEVDKALLPKSNLVFLIDVSGSMDEPDKLPLLKNALAQLVEELGENDKISIVAYESEARIILDSARGNNKQAILSAMKALEAGGSTGGAEGIELAYKLARQNFLENGNNRVILATDGDFNVGPSSLTDLEEIITQKKESGIFLSVMGFGSGNLKDNKLELLADKGNGNYSYIDSPREANRVLVKEMSGTLLTIAKDVKIQLEFNPYSIKSYRLIGYENRALKNSDFKNDKADAGELGAGHSVTAIYEIVPGKAKNPSDDHEELKYQSSGVVINKDYLDEITEIRLRYKEPDEEESKEIRQVVTYANTPVKGFIQTDDFYFKAAVAEFGMLLRSSEYMGNTSIDSILELAQKGAGEDAGGYRSEFISLVEKYKDISWYGW